MYICIFLGVFIVEISGCCYCWKLGVHVYIRSPSSSRRQTQIRTTRVNLPNQMSSVNCKTQSNLQIKPYQSSSITLVLYFYTAEKNKYPSKKEKFTDPTLNQTTNHYSFLVFVLNGIKVFTTFLTPSTKEVYLTVPSFPASTVYLSFLVKFVHSNPNVAAKILCT